MPTKGATNFQDSVPLDETPENLWSYVKDELYPHWFLDHLDYGSFKVVLRTWLQYWICFLLTIIERPSAWLGPSGYVINIGSSIEASGSISIATSILIGISAVAFMFYGVLCVTVANAITWHLRGYPTKAATMAQIAAQGLCAQNDESCMISQLQKGLYLETRCSVIHLIAMIWALTSIGWLSVRFKVFTLSWYFFSIPLALSCVSNVVIPYFDPWHYARAIVVPISISSCARVFFSCVIFPTSSNGRFMDKIVDTLQNASTVLSEFVHQQQTLRPSDDNFIEVHNYTRKKLHELFNVKSLVQTDKLMSKFEISYSRLTPGQLLRVHQLSLEIASAMSDHLFFFTELQKQIQTEHLDVEPSRSHTHKLRRYLSANEQSKSRYAPIGAFEREMKELHGPVDHGHHANIRMSELDEFYEQVSRHNLGIAQASLDLQVAITEWAREANEWRTYSLLSRSKWKNHQKRQIETSEGLILAHKKLQELIDNHSPCKIDTLAIAAKLPIFTREMTAYYGFATITLAKRMLLLSCRLSEIDRLRPCPTLLTPVFSAFRSFASLDIFNQAENLEVEETYEVFKPLARVQARNPDSTLPRNRMDKFGRFVLRLWHNINDEMVLFALKRALFTAACYIPIYCRTTVHLFFSKRLGWVSAMVALTVSRQAVDGIYGFIVRSSFTCYGCALACVGWYIARGNPYGHATIMGVFFAYLSWHRHFCNHLNAVSPIILSLSIVIVEGGSYAIYHYHPVGLDLTPGWEVAWVRCVCVLTGLAIALVGTFTPRPYTGKQAIRNLQGVMLNKITDLYSSVHNFSMQRYDNPKVPSTEESFEAKLLEFFTLSQSADMLRTSLRFEPPLGGAWPKNRYKILINNQQELAQILWMSFLMFGEVDDPKQLVPHLLWLLGWTSPNLSQSTYSLLYMCSRSIVTGEALPAISPSFLSEMHAGKFDNRLPRSDLGFVSTFLARLMYERLDGIMLIVKGLVGETFDVDTRAYRFDDEFDEEAASLMGNANVR